MMILLCAIKAGLLKYTQLIFDRRRGIGRGFHRFDASQVKRTPLGENLKGNDDSSTRSASQTHSGMSRQFGLKAQPAGGKYQNWRYTFWNGLKKRTPMSPQCRRRRAKRVGDTATLPLREPHPCTGTLLLQRQQIHTNITRQATSVETRE